MGERTVAAGKKTVVTKQVKPRKLAKLKKPAKPKKLAKPQQVVKPKKLTKREMMNFRKLLESKREEIMRNAQKTLGDSMALDAAELPDDMDLASSEYLQYFTLRLRGREKTYLGKIEKAIGRIDKGTFGFCDDCGEFIGTDRLTVRPEATLCIRCKEAQERDERQFS